jgi:hypothetical protein
MTAELQRQILNDLNRLGRLNINILLALDMYDNKELYEFTMEACNILNKLRIGIYNDLVIGEEPNAHQDGSI